MHSDPLTILRAVKDVSRLYLCVVRKGGDCVA